MANTDETKNIKILKNLKVVLMGDGGTGKSTWARRHRTGDFQSEYIATMGVEVHPIPFQTNKGRVVFNVWDTAGQEKFGDLKDGYYVGADAGIVFFDVTSRLSYRNATTWIASFRRKCPTAPIVLVGNKCDVKERVVNPASIKPPKSVQYYDLSAKSNYNYEKPFLYIVRKVINEDVHFVDESEYVEESETEEESEVEENSLGEFEETAW